MSNDVPLGKEWQEVDKWVSNAIKSGHIKPKSWENTARNPIRAVKYNSDEGPVWDHQRWLENSCEMLDLLDKVENKEIIPTWDMLNFRYEGDFRAGIFSEFVQFWPIAINKLGTEKIKQIAYKMVHWGLSATDNQDVINENRPKTYRKRTNLATDFKINDHYLQVKKKMGISDHENKFELSDTLYDIRSYYPVESKRIMGTWEKRPYIQPNQQKILKNKKVMHEQILKWVEQGVLEYIAPINKYKPKLVTSLVLANKEGSDVYRICFDGGAWKVTQKYLVPCQLDTVHDALQQIDPGDYLSKSDDKSGFLQCKFDDSSKDLTTVRWGGHYFRFHGAIFGLGRVPGDFQLVNNCAVSYLRSRGIPVTLYLDDRLVVEKGLTPEQVKLIQQEKMAPPNAFMVLALIIALGGFISRKKTIFICDTRITFLGFVIDTIKQTVEIPEEKWDILQNKIGQIMKLQRCEYKALEILRGYMCSMILVINNLRLFIRRITEKLKLADENNSDWILVDDRLKEELSIWQAQNKYIRKVRPWIEKTPVDINPLKIYTDASGACGGWVEPDGTERTFRWSKKYEKKNIAVKEALAILFMMQQRKILFRNKRITFCCDNKAVELAFEVGAKNNDLNDAIRDINILAIDINCIAKIIWVDTKSQKADQASRTTDYKEEEIDNNIYKLIKNKLQLSINLDGMASFYNNKEERYISYYKEDGSIAKNFLTYPLEYQDKVYAFPPKNMAPIVANHLYRSENEFILIFQIISELPFFVACRPKNVIYTDVKELLPEEFEKDPDRPITYLPCKKETKYGYKCPNKKTGRIGILYRKLQ